MAKTAEKSEVSVQESVLDPYLKGLKAHDFDRVEPLEINESEQAAAVVWGSYKGLPTPRIFVWALGPGHWEKANADEVQARSWGVMPAETPEDQFPLFGVVVDGEHQAFFDISYPPHEIDQLPSIKEITEYKRIKADPTYRWSLQMYDRLMRGFDAFHEQVYQNVKDKVSSKNDIILEVAKFLFLESFRLNHEPTDLEFKYKNKKLQLNEIFTLAYVTRHQEKAVVEIQAAFDHFKNHQDYVVTDDFGEAHAIFDEQTHLFLARPQNYRTLLKLIQDLGPVVSNSGETIKEHGTLADIAGDVLGRVFDVFLRGKFESKGGLGVYLTPAPVKQAMLSIAFHDIMEETPEILSARDGKGLPSFRFCDPTCGSYGFGVVALGHTERALMEILGKETAPDARRDPLFRDMCEHSFVGADSAPVMIKLARVNMAMLGAPKAKIFYTEDSLISPQLRPCSFDLICTNPPFGTPKFSKSQASAKKAYAEAKERILAQYRVDLHEREKKKGTFDYEPTVDGLAMGGKPDSKGVWKPAKATIDPAILFIDRCLQLLKSGGRLLIVVPDGVLCNSGDRYVREYIMGKKDETTGQFHGGKAIVKAVISLPSDTFKLSGTGAKTSILYLQKRKAREEDLVRFQDEPQGSVFMAVADTLGYVVKNNVEDYSTGVSNDLAAIVGAYVRGE